MAAKYYNEYYDITGRLLRIEIHDSTYGGAAIEFKTKAPGLQLSYTGDNASIHSRIMGSSATIPFVVETLTQETILTDILSSPEAELTVKFTIDGTLEWAGYIIADGSAYQDLRRDHKYTFELKAVDGLGRLKGLDYVDGSGDPYTGKATMLSIIQKCLGKIGEIQSFWGTSDTFLTTTMYWAETANMTTGNPLANSRIDQDIFYEIQRDGTFKPLTCYKVLEHILRGFYLGMRLSQGSWWIFQWSSMGETNLTTYEYVKAGTLSTSGSGTYSTTVNRTDQHRLAGGAYSFISGLNKVEATYKFDRFINYFDGVTEVQFLAGKNIATDLQSGPVKVKFRGTIVAKVESASAFDPHNLIFKFTVGFGSRYLKREKRLTSPGDGSYEPIEWNTSSASRIDFYSQRLTNSINGITFTIPVDIESTVYTDSGDMYFSYQYFGAVDEDFNTYAPGGISVYYEFVPDFFYIYTTDEKARPDDEAVYTIENDTVGYSETLEVTTIFGQRYETEVKSGLEVYNGVGWNRTGNWAADGGTAMNITKLLAKELLSVRKSNVKTVTGGFYGDGYTAIKRVIYDSEVYVFLSGTYDPYNAIIDGVWAKLAKQSTATTIDDVRIEPIRAIGTGVATTNVDEPGRIISTGILQQQALSTITSAVSTGDTVTTIDITNTGLQNLNAGDVLRILDPTTGLVQFYQLAADVAPGDTTASIVSTTATADLNSGSVITLASKFQKGVDLNEFLVFDVYKGNVSAGAGSTDIFYRPPVRLQGRRLRAIHAALHTAPTGTRETTVNILKDGSAFQTITFDSSTAQDTLDLTDVFLEDSLYEITVSETGTGSSANGLVVTFEISGQSNQYWITPDGQVWTWM